MDNKNGPEPARLYNDQRPICGISSDAPHDTRTVLQPWLKTDKWKGGRQFIISRETQAPREPSTMPKGELP